MVDILSGLASFVVMIWNLFAFIITDISLIISIILDPFLFLMIVLTLANIYTVMVSKTRREIVVNYGRFFSMVANAIFNVIVATIPVIVFIYSSIISLIQGAMSSGLGTGTLVTIAVIAILLAYSLIVY